MKFNDIFTLLFSFSPVVLIIGITIGTYYYKYLNPVHKSIVVYLFSMLLIDRLSIIIGYFNSKNNLIVLLFYSLIEMMLFIVFYYRLIFKAKHRFIMGVSCLGILYILYEIFILQQTVAKEFQSYAKVVDNFIIIMLSLGFFYEKINIYKESNWDNFRLNTIILIFFSVNLIFFLPINFLINETSGLKHYFWIGNLIITVSFYLYLTHCIWKNGRTRRLLPSGSQ